MAKRLTDKEKKKIIADYVKCQNYSEVARKYGISRETVRKTVANDSESCEKLHQKANENTQDVLAYMDSQKGRVKSVLSKLLVAMESKADNVDMFTNVRDLATAYGIILDKEYKRLEVVGVGGDDNKETDPLSQSLMDLAGEIDGD